MRVIFVVHFFNTDIRPGKWNVWIGCTSVNLLPKPLVAIEAVVDMRNREGKMELPAIGIRCSD